MTPGPASEPPPPLPQVVEVGQRRTRARKAYLTRELTLRELAALLGMGDTRRAARRLSRQLTRRERRAEVTIIQRDPHKTNSPGTVTIATLRHHCPDLLDARPEALDVVREQLAEMREAIAESRARDKALAARIRAQDAEIQRLRTQQR